MAGLLNGAMAGLGQGMSEAGNFLLRAKADEVKEARLQQYELAKEQRQNQRQDRIRSEDRKWALEDYTRQREDTLADYYMQRGHDVEDRNFNAREARWQTNATQAGANRRTAMQINASREEGRNDWQLVPDGNGGYGRYSPSRNEWGESAIPAGANINGGKLTDTEKYQLDSIADSIENIRSGAKDEMRALTKEERMTIGALENDRDVLLNSDQPSLTPFQQLQQGEANAAPEEANQPETASIKGQVRQHQENQQNTREANDARRQASQARDSADAVLKRIEREAAGGASRGGLLAQVNRAAGRGEVSQEAIAEAQQVAMEILALDQNPLISADDKRWLSERLIRLQEAGVPIDNLDQ